MGRRQSKQRGAWGKTGGRRGGGGGREKEREGGEGREVGAGEGLRLFIMSYTEF